MKNIVLSLVSIIALNSMCVAGVDIVPAAVPAQEVEEDYFYAGIALIYHRTFSIDQGWLNDNKLTQDETGGLTGILGYNYNEYLAFEGRISKSFFKEDYADVLNYSIFVKPQYRFEDDKSDAEDYDDGYFSVYGLLGFGVVQVDGADGAVPAHLEDIGKNILDDSSFQWGLGLSYTFTDDQDEDKSGDISLYIEYTRLIDDADIDSRLYVYDSKYYDALSQDALSVGMTYRF